MDYSSAQKQFYVRLARKLSANLCIKRTRVQKVLLIPVGEHLGRQPFARLIPGGRNRSALGGDDRSADGLVEFSVFSTKSPPRSGEGPLRYGVSTISVRYRSKSSRKFIALPLWNAVLLEHMHGVFKVCLPLGFGKAEPTARVPHIASEVEARTTGQRTDLFDGQLLHPDF